MKECIFCNKNNIRANIVHEDNKTLAFMDMDPINEGHILLIPKDHYLDLDEIPNEILSHMMSISKVIVSALKEIYNPDGYSIMQNGGAFNDIGHFHIHIFPRYKEDGFGWTYGDDIINSNTEIAKTIRDKINDLV